MRTAFVFLMVAIPVMGAQAGEPSGLSPQLDMKMRAGWRYDAASGVFEGPGGATFSPQDSLPPRSRILHMVPALQTADLRRLTKDERNLARYLQIVFPKRMAPEAYIVVVEQWPCTESVASAPKVGLP